MAKDKKARLFGEFFYGMPRKDVVGMTQAEPCEDAKNGLVLCAPELVAFLQDKWRQIFYFNNLDELQQIILTINDGESARFSNIMKSLKDSGWQPVFMESDKDALDLLADSSAHGQEGSEDSPINFQKQVLAENGDLTVYFFPATYFEKLSQ